MKIIRTSFFIYAYLIKVLGLTTRNRKRLPFTALDLFADIHYLPYMIAVMAYLPEDSFHHSVRLATDKDFFFYIVIRYGTNKSENAVPSLIPSFSQFIER